MRNTTKGTSFEKQLINLPKALQEIALPDHPEDTIPQIRIGLRNLLFTALGDTRASELMDNHHNDMYLIERLFRFFDLIERGSSSSPPPSE